MINVNTLDTVIAMVIVLLILSLVVQSVQQALKKLLKIKSRQIEDSLVDLFEHVLFDNVTEKKGEPAGLLRRIVQNSPLLRLFGGKHPAAYNDDVKRLYGEVKKGFEQAGRVSQRGKLMLDSIAKSDLMKVLTSVAPDALNPKFKDKFISAKSQYDALAAAVGAFKPSEFSEHLSDEAKEKLAKMQGALRPLVNDIRAYLSGEVVPGAGEEFDEEAGGEGGKAGGGAKADKTAAEGEAVTHATLLKDVIKLNSIRLEDVSRLISEAQKAVDEQLARAEQDPNGAAAVAALTGGANTLRALAASVATFDRAVDQLLANITRAEKWFDTVMQGFEERYARSMRTWGVVISLVVVILLNANFFDVYKNIATNDTLRGNLVQMRGDVERLYAESAARGDTNATQTFQQWRVEAEKNLRASAANYTSLGFTPLWQCWGKCTTADGIPHSVLGWVVMALLLSVGAPFWQDALESLFGLKNVLRKRSDTKNVEDKGGQPKP